MTGKATLYASRTIEALLILCGIMIFVAPTTIGTFLWTALWGVLAVLYLAIRVTRLRRSKHGTRMEWLTRGIGGGYGLLFTVLTSAVGIGSGFAIVLSENEDDKFLSSAAGVPCVLLAWAILHFGYAERYAKSYYRAPEAERPLAFPNTEAPTFVEFSYFAFTIGTTFSVSDVETQSSAIRSQILAHSILSFLYNTATIAIVIGVISG
ncbi:DUF1345 domain-containing protein [Actinoplanes sp. NBRC 103695]|uniref:DUF1345 domain-containing protein n=1 Tax=Actinoplanes sp. NBRC 103695 TaxID=3032202 RepID=UPI0024A498E0|nr:DUF1345 domain-containing protein [Actinoplanes sp. NBRC 103695]GLY97327.1 membrane protein [Actinoplanes sp. NBRC 103695]